eukprot:COSAG05_NODE_2248_length_3341_cov_228.208721_2_plen_46_part_00
MSFVCRYGHLIISFTTNASSEYCSLGPKTVLKSALPVMTCVELRS